MLKWVSLNGTTQNGINKMEKCIQVNKNNLINNNHNGRKKKIFFSVWNENAKKKTGVNFSMH